MVHLKAAELLKGTKIDNPGPESLPNELITIMKEIGIPSGLKEIGYVEKDISEIVAGAIKQERLLSIAPKNVEETNLTNILTQSMENW